MNRVKFVLLLLLTVVLVEARKGGRNYGGSRVKVGGPIYTGGNKHFRSEPFSYGKGKPKGRDWNYLNKVKSKFHTRYLTKAFLVGGLFLGYQLTYWNNSNMDQYYKNPFMGYYGYYQDVQFVRCPPPIVVSINDTLSIPSELNQDYDRRCQYYSDKPPNTYDYDPDYDWVWYVLILPPMLISYGMYTYLIKNNNQLPKFNCIKS